MSRLVVFLALLLSQGHPKTPWASIFFQWDPKKVANRVMFCSDFGSNAFFELYINKLQIGFSQKELAKKVLNSGFKLLF